MYLQEIADYFVERRGGALFLSHRDFARILEWETRGIAPATVKEAIDELFEGLRGPDGRPVRTVRGTAYLERVVMAKHRARRRRLECRLEPGEPPETPLAERITVNLPALRRRVLAALAESGLEGAGPAAAELDAGFGELLAAAAAGRLDDYDAACQAFHKLDDALAVFLAQAVPPALREQARDEARRRLARGGSLAAGPQAARAAAALGEELLRRRYGLERIALYVVV